jgi:hypothetical protein
MDHQKRYPGIHKDPQGAMNPTGNIIRKEAVERARSLGWDPRLNDED